MKFGKFGKLRIEVSSLSCDRVLDKLAREKIAVFSARKTRKNQISFEVLAKDSEKVFAILRGSCYNIVEVRGRGLNLFYKKCLSCVGLILGAALFCLLVLGAEKRIFRIDVVGSGAYYEPQIIKLLEEGGVKKFSEAPKETAEISAKILSLPRVSYCSIGAKGGILTVEVRVSEETVPLKSEKLSAPLSGKIEEMTVLRGTPLAAVGDEVQAGQILVENYAISNTDGCKIFDVKKRTAGF